MKMGRCSRMLVGLVFVGLALLEITSVTARDYVVGDNYGWDIPPGNSSDYYTSWASKYVFQVGDVAVAVASVVVFNWTGDHTATRVNKEEYDRCDTNVGIKLRGDAGVRVPLEAADLHYYICSVDSHCQRGQKVSFNVTGSSSSVPALPTDAAPFSATLLLSMAALCFLCLCN